jgi:hypothetical protein
MLNRRRYTIESSILTLARFTEVMAKFGPTSSHVVRLAPNSTDEYYYVVVLADQEVHDALKAARFDNSYAMAGDGSHHD